MNVLGLFEVCHPSTTRTRAAAVAALHDELAVVRAELAAERAAGQAARTERDNTRPPIGTAIRSGSEPTCARASTVGKTPVGEPIAETMRFPQVITSDRPAPDGHPPPVATELIVLADRLVDLTGPAAPTDIAQAATALSWLRTRLDELLGLCEVTRIVDDGPLDPLRHEVLADRPAPDPASVDCIAATVRPGYRWRRDVLRPQQVVAYVAPDTRKPAGRA